jgi:hypothetical protein
LKAITLEELSRIWADYKIPRDVRAEKEIEALAFDTMEWTGWHRPDCLLPDMDRQEPVLVIVSGKNETQGFHHVTCEATWEPEKGWLLDRVMTEFTVERWAYYPTEPKEIRDDIERLLKEELS